MLTKTIKIREQTHGRLLDFGQKGESFDMLFNRMLDTLEKHGTDR